MRDHKRAAAAPRTSKNAVGVRELKTHAARILRHVRDARASYLLTHRGHAIAVILPIEGSDVPERAEDADPIAAWNAFLRAGRHLEPRFRPGVSAVNLLSATRR